MVEIPPRRQRIADLHRPQYHFLPPSNWMNDPNGVVQWNGRYHLFFQHNPSSPLWGNMHWGHASSPDLIHWTDEPLALAPTPGGPDESGCFSGCIVDNDGVPTLIYTATAGQHNEIQTQSLATGDDDLRTWVKDPHNPVLSEIPPLTRQTKDFRDPFVWKEDDAWYMVVGSRVQDVGGIVFLYRSANLIDWEYLHPLLSSDDERLGAIWECPNFFKLGEQWVLIISSHTGTQTDRVHYFVGEYQNHRFTPMRSGVLDYGCLYAPLSFVDDQHRRILFGWLREERSNTALERAGWAGVQSVPRVLELDAHNRLLMRPIPELERIRGLHHVYEANDLDRPMRFSVDTLSLDVAVEFELDASGVCDLVLTYSTSPEEFIHIRYDVHSQQIIVRKRAESPDAAGVTLLEAPHQLAADGILKLRLLVDGSAVEVIANDRTSVSTRFYSTTVNNVEFRLSGESACLRALDVWEMPSILEVSATENLT